MNDTTINQQQQQFDNVHNSGTDLEKRPGIDASSEKSITEGAKEQPKLQFKSLQAKLPIRDYVEDISEESGDGTIEGDIITFTDRPYSADTFGHLHFKLSDFDSGLDNRYIADTRFSCVEHPGFVYYRHMATPTQVESGSIEFPCPTCKTAVYACNSRHERQLFADNSAHPALHYCDTCLHNVLITRRHPSTGCTRASYARFDICRKCAQQSLDVAFALKNGEVFGCGCDKPLNGRDQDDGNNSMDTSDDSVGRHGTASCGDIDDDNKENSWSEEFHSWDQDITSANNNASRLCRRVYKGLRRCGKQFGPITKLIRSLAKGGPETSEVLLQRTVELVKQGGRKSLAGRIFPNCKPKGNITSLPEMCKDGEGYHVVYGLDGTVFKEKLRTKKAAKTRLRRLRKLYQDRADIEELGIESKPIMCTNIVHPRERVQRFRSHKLYRSDLERQKFIELKNKKFQLKREKGRSIKRTAKAHRKRADVVRAVKESQMRAEEDQRAKVEALEIEHDNMQVVDPRTAHYQNSAKEREYVASLLKEQAQKYKQKCDDRVEQEVNLLLYDALPNMVLNDIGVPERQSVVTDRLLTFMKKVGDLDIEGKLDKTTIETVNQITQKLVKANLLDKCPIFVLRVCSKLLPVALGFDNLRDIKEDLASLPEPHHITMGEPIIWEDYLDKMELDLNGDFRSDARKRRDKLVHKDPVLFNYTAEYSTGNGLFGWKSTESGILSMELLHQLMDYSVVSYDADVKTVFSRIEKCAMSIQTINLPKWDYAAFNRFVVADTVNVAKALYLNRLECHKTLGFCSVPA